MLAMALATACWPFSAAASDCSATRADSAALFDTCCTDCASSTTAAEVSSTSRVCRRAASCSVSEIWPASFAALSICNVALLIPRTRVRSSSTV